MPSGRTQKYFHGDKLPGPPVGGYTTASVNSNTFKRLVEKLAEEHILPTPHGVYNEHSWLWHINPRRFLPFYKKAVLAMNQNHPSTSYDGDDYDRLVVSFADTSFNCNYLHSRTLHHFAITVFIRMHHQWWWELCRSTSQIIWHLLHPARSINTCQLLPPFPACEPKRQSTTRPTVSCT